MEWNSKNTCKLNTLIKNSRSFLHIRFKPINSGHTSNMHQRKTRNIGILLLMATILGFATILIIIKDQQEQNFNAEIINIAGRQRMLSQKISKYVFEIDGGAFERKKSLSDAINLYDDSLWLLHYGRKKEKISNIRNLPSAPRELDSLFYENKKIWSKFRKEALLITKTKMHNNQPLSYKRYIEAKHYVLKHNEKLLDISNRITEKFEIIFHNRMIRLRTYLYAVLGLNISMLLFAFLIIHDIKLYKKTEEDLKDLAFNDELTHTNNRTNFYLLANEQFKLADRQRSTLLVLFFDVDNMKKINDTYGHAEGDQLLIDTANILRSSLRQSDIVARIGGDEFVALINNIDAAQDQKTIYDNIKKVFELHNNESSKPYDISVSIGFSKYDYQNPSSLDNLLSTADQSMYKDKKHPRT